jgi:alpha-L-fucosidase
MKSARYTGNDSKHKRSSPVSIPKPSKSHYEWHELERMLMISFCPSSWQGQEYDDLSTPLSQIDPAQFDAEQWCRAALLWGAKEILLVAKHTGGFCLWQTDTSDYGIKETPFRGGKGDIVDDVYRACKRHGIKFGLYLSPADLYYDAYNGGGGKTRDPAKQEAYVRIYRGQLTELLERYPDTCEIWFDGGIIIPVRDILEKHAPHAMIFQGKERSTIRWAGNEAGEIPYPTWDTLRKGALETGLSTGANSDSTGDAWAPVEADVPLYNHFWFWSKKNESARRSLTDLMRIYYKSAGRGAVLMLNATPDTRGRIPEDDMAAYRAFGEELKRRFNKPLAAVDGTGNEFVLDLGAEKEVNHVILMEHYENGEKVRRFSVSAYSNGEWIPVVPQGSMIGRKQIFPFQTVKAAALKLLISESQGTPEIRAFEAYNVTDVDIEALSKALHETKDLYDCLIHARVETTGEAGVWTEYELDLSPCVLEAGQFTVSFTLPQDWKFEIGDPALVLEGIETEGMVEELKPGTYRITRSAAVDGKIGKSTALKFRYRMEKKVSDIPVTIQKL